MTPLLRRTWAPVGVTPVLYQRTRHHGKVSILGALSVSPRRRRVGLYFSLLTNRNATADDFVRFLQHLRRHLRGPIILIWDRLAAHRSNRVRAFLLRRGGIRLEYLPPYAPELNPSEQIWNYLKSKPLVNFAAEDAEELTELARIHAEGLQENQILLRSFIRMTPLSLRLR